MDTPEETSIITFPSNLTEHPTFQERNLLLEYGFRNFFAFKEGAIVSFRFDGNTPDTISQGRPAATVMGGNGANAAGKTHLLKALHFLSWFGARSFDWKPESKMPIEPFGDSTEPSEFYAEFKIGEYTYRYEISLTDEKVLSEILHRTKSKRVTLFERKGNAIAHTTKEFSLLSTLQLRNNVSIISTANQYQLPILGDVFAFFSNIITNVAYSGFHQPLASINETSEFLKKAPTFHKFVEAFICSCDTGVSKIKIHEREGEKGKPIYYPTFIHNIGNKEYEVSTFEESSGTKRLFSILPDYLGTLAEGGLLVVDEFDLHLHPRILPKLIDLFTDEDTNPHNAQLIFTSHDSRIMDSLGRYRTYIVEKQDNESFAFRIDEVPGDMLRNDRPISPIYEDGKIGGVPHV